MSLKYTFFGGAGDTELGELGGVQGLFHDTKTGSKFMLDIGQRPDHYNQFYGFPYKPKAFNSLAISEFLQFYPEMRNLYRHDYERRRGVHVGDLPLDAILATHVHFDHVGGLPLIRHDMPVWMDALGKKVLHVWQQTSGRTVNQFLDMYDAFSTVPKPDGEMKLLTGDAARLTRDVRLFESGEQFDIGSFKITPYFVDHSLPGACGFLVESSSCKFGISGDIRMRGQHPGYTHAFIKALEKADIDYLFWEGSLLHFPHNGDEHDVANVIEELMKGKSFCAIAYPPRDLDRITSCYKAAKAAGRMLVVNAAQALTLMELDGANGYPKMDWKYIGVMLRPKRKGYIGEDVPEEQIEKDYFGWERGFVRKKHWEEHSSGLQRVEYADIAANQDCFLVYMPQNYVFDDLIKINPAEGSRYIRSHPAPWTTDMMVQEQQLIRSLEAFGMYEGPKPDCLTPSEEKLMWQVHVTGHLNREETRDVLRRFKCPIIPYHTMHPTDFVMDVASHTDVRVPNRGEAYEL